MYSSSMTGEDLPYNFNRNAQSAKIVRVELVHALRGIISQLTKARSLSRVSYCVFTILGKSD